MNPLNEDFIDNAAELLCVVRGVTLSVPNVLSAKEEIRKELQLRQVLLHTQQKQGFETNGT